MSDELRQRLQAVESDVRQRLHQVEREVGVERQITRDLVEALHKRLDGMHLEVLRELRLIRDLVVEGNTTNGSSHD